MKNMVKDEFGFISGRGNSKYWGVSTQNVEQSVIDPWVVKFADPYIPVGKPNRYRVFTAKDFVLSEEDAAIIGAYFHENPMVFGSYEPRLYFRSANKKFDMLVDTRNKTITKAITLAAKPERPVKEHEEIELSKADLLKAQQKQFDEIISSLGKENETDYNRGFSEGFALNEIISRRLGPKSLKEILKAVETRLNKGN
jgi:hypothetical protein